MISEAVSLVTVDGQYRHPLSTLERLFKSSDHAVRMLLRSMARRSRRLR